MSEKLNIEKSAKDYENKSPRKSWSLRLIISRISQYPLAALRMLY